MNQFWNELFRSVRFEPKVSNKDSSNNIKYRRTKWELSFQVFLFAVDSNVTKKDEFENRDGSTTKTLFKNFRPKKLVEWSNNNSNNSTLAAPIFLTSTSMEGTQHVFTENDEFEQSYQSIILEDLGVFVRAGLRCIIQQTRLSTAFSFEGVENILETLLVEMKLVITEIEPFDSRVDWVT